MADYHNDFTVKFEHSAVSNSTETANNVIGATTNTTIRTIDYTPSNSNSIYVSSSGESWNYSSDLFETPQARSIDLITGDVVKDSATGYWKFLASNENDVDLTSETYTEGARWTEVMGGTSSEPIASVKQACELITATKTKIYIVDGVTYNEEPFILPSDCAGIYAAVGYAPTININHGVAPQVSSVLLDDISTAPDHYFSACRLLSGDIFVVYDDNGDLKCRTLDGATYVDNDDEQTISTSVYGSVDCCLTDDNDIFLVVADGSDTEKMKYAVIDKDDFTTFIKSFTTLDSNICTYPNCVLKDNGDIFVLYNRSSDSRYAIITSSTYAIGASSTLFIASTSNPTINILKTGNFLVTYYKSGTWYYQIRQQDWTSVTGETALSATPENWMDACILSNGYILIMMDTDDYVVGYGSVTEFEVYDTSFNLVYGPTTIDMNRVNRFRVKNFDDNGFFIGNANQAAPDPDTLVYHTMIGLPYYIETNSICKFDGVILETDYQFGMTHYISQNEDLTLKHCTIQNFPEISGEDDLSLILNQSDYDNVINNCAFLDNNMRLFLTTNNADIQENIFFNVRGAPCLEIDGNGVNIEIVHNTFFNSYAGVLLTNNDGDEIIKDCIFHECVNYDVDITDSGGTTLIITYCIQTGVLGLGTVKPTSDANSLTANPYFIDEGVVDTDSLNLNLKNKILGYALDSPAIGVASDSKNIGAYDVTYTYVADTYTEIEVSKPNIIDIQYKPVNSILNEMVNGAVRTYKDGMNKTLTMEWVGLKNEEYILLLDMWANNVESVKIYLDPTTSPLEYENYYLNWSDIKGSPKHPMLSRTGVQDVKMTFIKLYSG